MISPPVTSANSFSESLPQGCVLADTANIRRMPTELQHFRISANLIRQTVYDMTIVGDVASSVAARADPRSAAAVMRRLRAMGIRDKPIALGSLWESAFAERNAGLTQAPCPSTRATRRRRRRKAPGATEAPLPSPTRPSDRQPQPRSGPAHQSRRSRAPDKAVASLILGSGWDLPKIQRPRREAQTIDRDLNVSETCCMRTCVGPLQSIGQPIPIDALTKRTLNS